MVIVLDDVIASMAVVSDKRADHDEDGARAVTRGAPDVVFYYQLSPLPTFNFISASVTRILGYSPGDHYENPMLWMEIVDADDREWFSTFWIQSRSSGREVFRFIRRDGRPARLEISLTLFKDERGSTRAMQGCVRDLTQANGK